MQESKPKLVITKDGSTSIYLPDLDEHYHSVHGAIQEAQHVFIQAGIRDFPGKEISIFEVGFGTGLNAYLSFLESRMDSRSFSYTGIEAFPVPEEMISSLNYIELLGGKYASVFEQMHQVVWEEAHNIEGFLFRKIKSTVQDLQLDQNFNLIFFDAFGPRVQEEMWTEAVFHKMFELLENNGCLVTYCAKGSVKRALKSVGFKVETLPGPPGKREMTRAVKYG